jgi:hypothetical protein
VSFGDVLLSSEQVRTGPDGGDLSPGAGGWPTVRYFNKGTGYDGKPYAQKTDKAMCDELGNEDNMEAFVVDFGGASLCAVADGAGCTDKEKKFIEKWKAADAGKVAKQLTRLEGMSSKPMKKELMQWLKQRLAILKQLSSKEEL